MVSESSNLRVHPNQVSPVELPDLLECAESKGVPGFDTVELGSSAAVASQPPPAMVRSFVQQSYCDFSGSAIKSYSH